jgi:hypothetical protein
MLAIRSMSHSCSGGSKPLSRSASMLLPLPGGPIIKEVRSSSPRIVIGCPPRPLAFAR